MLGYFIVAGLLSLVGVYVGARLRSKFKKYSRLPNTAGMTGREVAEAMLRHYNISDVQITQGRGMLTDHYNPAKKVVSLSPEVYQGRSIASAAVAAHECGHAVQHATNYSMLQVRSSLVPIVQFSANIQQWVLLAAFMTIGSMPSVMLLAIAVFGITALFSFVTLPVEFDASKRALAWLDNSQVATGEEYSGAKDALWWAAMTYVSAALSALVMLLYLVLRYMSAGD